MLIKKKMGAQEARNVVIVRAHRQSTNSFFKPLSARFQLQCGFSFCVYQFKTTAFEPWNHWITRGRNNTIKENPDVTYLPKFFADLGAFRNQAR